MSDFDLLPPEVLCHILSYLSIPELLIFGVTSRANHVVHKHCLNTLHLAVFPKKVHSLIAFLQHRHDDDVSSFASSNQNEISITLPGMRFKNGSSKKSVFKEAIRRQNTYLEAALLRYGQSLQTLSFHAYNITSASASVLAQTGSRLKSLSLFFDHPVARVSYVPTHYFDTPTDASPLWNALAGIGELNDKNLKLRNLEKLNIERSGITSFQLCRFISANPRLSELRLKKVSGVDPEFVAWLGQYEFRERLEMLHLENCALGKTEENLEWVGKLTGLKSLGLTECGIGQDLVQKLNNEVWHIAEVVDIEGIQQAHMSSKVLEVDPYCI